MQTMDSNYFRGIVGNVGALAFAFVLGGVVQDKLENYRNDLRNEYRLGSIADEHAKEESNSSVSLHVKQFLYVFAGISIWLVFIALGCIGLFAILAGISVIITDQEVRLGCYCIIFGSFLLPFSLTIMVFAAKFCGFLG